MSERAGAGSARAHRRPAPQQSAFFDEYVGGADPAAVSMAAERAAEVVVRGARASDDAAIADRLVRLSEDEGIEAIAELWSGAPADSLAGCLWRLFVLRSWTHADPSTAAEQFEAGRASAEFAHVVAGVADPPGPDEMRSMTDQVLRGIAVTDFADVLLRASAFARVVAAGRARLGADGGEVRRMLGLAEQLEAAGHLELGRGLE